jgi:cytochrome b561
MSKRSQPTPKSFSAKHWMFIIALIIMIGPSLFLLQNGELLKGFIQIGEFIISVGILVVFFAPLALLWRFIKQKIR